MAQYADACNFMGYIDKDQRQRKLDILREHCQALGRPYEQIEKTLVYFLHITSDGRNSTLSPQAAIDCLADLASEKEPGAGVCRLLEVESEGAAFGERASAIGEADRRDGTLVCLALKPARGTNISAPSTQAPATGRPTSRPAGRCPRSRRGWKAPSPPR